MNKVSLLGRICNDLEVKEAGDNKYVRFSLAVNRRYENEDGKRDADFISCVAWNGSAETIQKYFKKGSQIGISGRIQTGSYDKEDGSKAYTTDVIIEDFDFVDKKTDDRPAPEYTGKTDTEIVNEVAESDPFADMGEKVSSESELPF